MIIAGGRTPVRSTFVGSCVGGINISWNRVIVAVVPGGWIKLELFVYTSLSRR